MKHIKKKYQFEILKLPIKEGATPSFVNRSDSETLKEINKDTVPLIQTTDGSYILGMHYNYNGAQTIIPLPDLALVYFDFGHISNTIKKRKVMILKKTDYVKDLNKLHLHCPICDFEYTHLMGVKTYNDTEGRLAVTLYFECEEKHKFEHDIHNHKGYTLITDGEE